MNSSIYISSLMLLCMVGINALGVSGVVPPVASNVEDVKTGSTDEKPRFMDFDSLITNAMSGMNIKVDKYMSHSQGSSVVKKVTQSHGTLGGGQTIVQTEITEYSGNNPVGLRFKRDLLENWMGQVEEKAELVKHKLAGAMADSVNLAQSGINKVKNAINGRLTN